MHVLTIFDHRRKEVKTIETFAPPDPAMIEEELKQVPNGWYDISRKELDAEDFDYRDQEEIQ